MQTYPDHIVRRITSDHRGPWCRFKVDATRVGVRRETERLRLARIKGTEPDECAYPCEIEIDGTGYCRRHAGEVLLREYVGPPAKRFGR